jgi:hypothetical protein
MHAAAAPRRRVRGRFRFCITFVIIRGCWQPPPAATPRSGAACPACSAGDGARREFCSRRGQPKVCSLVPGRGFPSSGRSRPANRPGGRQRGEHRGPTRWVGRRAHPRPLCHCGGPSGGPCPDAAPPAPRRLDRCASGDGGRRWSRSNECPGPLPRRCVAPPVASSSPSPWARDRRGGVGGGGRHDSGLPSSGGDEVASPPRGSCYSSRSPNMSAAGMGEGASVCQPVAPRTARRATRSQ